MSYILYPINVSGGIYSSVLTYSHNEHNLNYMNYLYDRIFLCKILRDIVMLLNSNFNTELKQIVSTSKKYIWKVIGYMHISAHLVSL